MQGIILNTGLTALVDDDDYEFISQWKWKEIRRYAARTIWKDGKYGTLLMHRLIMDAPPDLDVHHINGNELDNRKENLELVDPSEHARHHSYGLVAAARRTRKNPQWKVCQYDGCGRVFRPVPSNRRKQKYCSLSCGAYAFHSGKVSNGTTTSRNSQSVLLSSSWITP